MNKKDDCSKFSESNNQKLFLYYIGRFDIIHKGLDILFDALEILDNQNEKICITFFGKGNEEEEKYIDARIDKISNIDIKKYGPIYGEEKESLLRQYDAMVLTSRYEGFPMTVLEALSYGVPCLVTEGTNVGDFLQEANVGDLLGNTPQEVASGILAFKEEYLISRQDYSQRCQDYVKARYLWIKIAEQSKKLFDEFLEE